MIERVAPPPGDLAAVLLQPDRLRSPRERAERVAGLELARGAALREGEVVLPWRGAADREDGERSADVGIAEAQRLGEMVVQGAGAAVRLGGK